MPNIEAMPLKTLEFVEEYVKKGGTVIALERVPDSSTGFVDYKVNDKKVQEIAARLFDIPRGRDATAEKSYGDGTTYQIKQVLDRSIWWDKRSSVLDPFINTIRKHIAPDFGIDFAHEGLRKNEGLTFQHRKFCDTHIYFVTNIQDKESNIPVTFRVKNKNIEKWNPYNGEVSGVYNFREEENGIKIPLSLAPYESTFLVFKPGEPEQYVSKTDFQSIANIVEGEIEAVAKNNGVYNTKVNQGGVERSVVTEVDGIPAPFGISGEWHVLLEKRGIVVKNIIMTHLTSWTNNEETKHFSGTGTYEITFDLPKSYVNSDIKLMLDLGKVGDIAEVIINGKNVGTVWMKGQTPDITNAVKRGKNSMTILVTNTLINRVSAMTEPMPVPENLVDRFGSSPTNTPGRLPREFGFKPLPASGLLGPVKIIAMKTVKLKSQ
jgi:hypothetical protein